MRVTYVSFDGAETSLDVSLGQSLMQVAVTHNVPGIVGECGGSAMCATCHVYIDEGFIARLPPPEPYEVDMLDCTSAERRPNSRLSCQVKLTAELDGIVAHTPEDQTR